jgi:homocysteine S-methyltransferase
MLLKNAKRMKVPLINPIQPFLDTQRCFILDGALASEMERRGANLNDPLWSSRMLFESPELVQQVCYDYYQAGADVAVSSTYQATFEGFERRGVGEREAITIFQKSIQLVKEAREDFWGNPDNRRGRLKPLVAASIGPYGAFLADGSEYSGHYSLSVPELMDFHRKRMSILVECEPDLLAFETIPNHNEVAALVKLLSEFPKMTAWLSLSTKGRTQLADETPFEKAVEIANQSDQIIAVGVNCLPPENVLHLLKIAQKITSKSLLAYPNSGEKWDAKNHCWLPDAEKGDFGKLSLEWYNAGARLIGGCCRTSMKDVANIRKSLQNSL